jgi:hypothetical protein
MKYSYTACRSGTVLIIIAGISALLVSLSLAFILRVRGDMEAVESMKHETQARIMLVAACNYVQEASRIGYDTLHDGTEAYGWIDIRDGSIGPKPTRYTAEEDARLLHNFTDRSHPFSGKDDDHLFPCEVPHRFEMYVKNVPPFAIRLDVAPNPIDWKTGNPYLWNPDPIPVHSPSYTKLPYKTTAGTASSWSDFEGDPSVNPSSTDSSPRLNSLGLSWFRLYRLGGAKYSAPKFPQYNAATFIVTCGAGGSAGYRLSEDPTKDEWNRMSSIERARFGSREMLQTLVNSEFRLWYLIEWSPAVGNQLTGTANELAGNGYLLRGRYFDTNNLCPANAPNMGGTIRLVQRLVKEPVDW